MCVQGGDAGPVTGRDGAVASAGTPRGSPPRSRTRGAAHRARSRRPVRRQVEDLANLGPQHGPASKVHTHGRPATCRCLRPDARRNNLGAGFADPSLLRGLAEFRELFTGRVSSSATGTTNAAISTFRCASMTSNCPTEGASEIGEQHESTTKTPVCGASRSTDRRILPLLTSSSTSLAARELNSHAGDR